MTYLLCQQLCQRYSPLSDHCICLEFVTLITHSETWWSFAVAAAVKHIYTPHLLGRRDAAISRVPCASFFDPPTPPFPHGAPFETPFSPHLLKPTTVRRAKQIKLQKLKCKQFVGVRLQLLLLVAIATPSSGASPPQTKQRSTVAINLANVSDAI